jgi:two-component system cell cycle response regulator
MDDGRTIQVTASIGVATFPAPRVATVEDLFSRADQALYRAKAEGRNRVRN